MNKPRKNTPKKSSAATKPKPQHIDYSTFNTQHSTLLLVGVCVIIFVCFHYTLQNQFLNWDDWIYIPKDKYITSFSAANLNSMLFHDITLNYYHPLTMLSLAVNYQFSHLNPWGYYFTTILLHILNAVLVFFFAKTLMDAMVKVGYKAIPVIPWIVAVGALIHGIHPMHVESVSWISERKDVMYAIFYFTALMMYVRYTEGKKFPWMLYLNIVFEIGCILGSIGLNSFSLDFTIKGHNFSIGDSSIFISLFILLAAAIVIELKYKKIKLELFYVLEIFLLSLFSKPMAVSFPLSILVVDLLLKRDIKFISGQGSWLYREAKALTKLVFEKWMFLFIAFLSGLQSIFLEIGHDTVVFTHGYNVFQKLLISCYSFTMYVVDAFYPVNLSSYYPFPNLTSDYSLPSIFYVMPLFALAIVCIPLYLVRKQKDLFRVVLFGVGFYFANVVFILQFLSAGTTIMSDRYSYVAYFGLIFLLVYLTHWFWFKNKSYRMAIRISLALICGILAYMCYERTLVWHNPETLWMDVIAKNHTQSQTPYFNLGSYYVDSGKYEKAYPEYVTLVKMNSKDAQVYRNLAMIYGLRRQYDSSLFCFSRAIKFDSVDATIYGNRAITYANLGRFDMAVKDFGKAYSVDTSQIGFLSQEVGLLLQLGKFNEAIADCNILIRKKPQEPGYYMQRGNTYLSSGNPGPAVQDYSHVLELQPKNGECMYDLSVCYLKFNDRSDALKYAIMAQSNGYKLPEGYLKTL